MKNVKNKQLRKKNVRPKASERKRTWKWKIQFNVYVCLRACFIFFIFSSPLHTEMEFFCSVLRFSVLSINIAGHSFAMLSYNGMWKILHFFFVFVCSSIRISVRFKIRWWWWRKIQPKEIKDCHNIWTKYAFRVFNFYAHATIHSPQIESEKQIFFFVVTWKISLFSTRMLTA